MARIRMIKPEFFDDPDLADLSMPARLFFVGLWTQADKEGRLVDDMRRLKARIFPFDDVDCEALTAELHDKDMIRRYYSGPAVEKHGFIWIKNFTRHQRPHPKEPASLIPPCENGAGKKHGEPGKNTAKPSDPNSGVRNLDSGSLHSEHGSADHVSDRFDRFWSAYPRKVGKDAARKEWAKRKPSEAITDLMIGKLQEQSRSVDWLKDGGQFIPHPRTWLSQGRWQDEPVATIPLARGAHPPRAAWRDECRDSGHDPVCPTPERHSLRLVVAARGCQHPGVCETLGHCKKTTDRLAEEAVGY